MNSQPAFVQGLSEALNEPVLLELVNFHNAEAQQRLKPLLQKLIAEQDYSYWCEFFTGIDCCVEPVLSVNEAASHPQIQARDMVINYQQNPKADGLPY